LLKSAPTAIFVFVFLLYVGGTKAPIYIVIILSFPILYEAVIGGFNNISPDILKAIKVDRGGVIYPLIHVKIPLAMPYILVGIASSFALSLKTEIMAEVIAGSTSPGLGNLIRIYRESDPSDLAPIFAIALMAIAVILIFDLISYLLKSKLIKDE
nr:ABC transporter permease subunit [Bacilli bacterium]